MAAGAGRGKARQGARKRSHASTGQAALAKPTGRPQRLANLRARSGGTRSESGLAATALIAPPRQGAVPEQSHGLPAASAETLCLPHPDWLWHVLTITGPADALADFCAAASGPGHIPWQPDYERLEEDWCLRLLAARPAGAEGGDPVARRISVQGARTAARQMRTALETLDEQRRGTESLARCPLDLHGLLPVPAKILQLGPEHPDSIFWLWDHWGTAWPLRHVEETDVTDTIASLPDGHAAFGVKFAAADWAPWRAVIALRERWPVLTFAIKILGHPE